MATKLRESVIVWVSVASFFVGVILSFLGLFLPPVGVVDNTVLVAVGQFLTLSAGGLGIREYVNVKLTEAINGNNKQ